MITPYYCPECGLRLREVRSAEGGVEPGWLVCKKDHGWIRSERTERGLNNEVLSREAFVAMDAR